MWKQNVGNRRTKTLGLIIHGLLGFGLLLAAKQSLAGAGAAVQFNRDIRPILSNNCFACHGPDEGQRQAELRLDTAEGLYARRDGYTIVAAGDPANSELFARISGEDGDLRMPPPDSGHELTKQQIERVRLWIEQGAEFEGHWSFIPPARPPLPVVAQSEAVGNPIDRFILKRLEEHGLAASARAERSTLLRRVTFDLTGLPPTLDELDHFLADGSPDAYERVVDRLLNSARYGEHMARDWLDAARYGDTHGLHLDNERSIWPYRDWVISAFNRNLPFDDFTVWQLAGDLLPNPTLEQMVATGFNRCNVTTSEGGAIPEEYRVKYGVDRVDTTATVWMGLTAGCAVCHDHKFDPISQAEFYELFAYFNSLDENPMDGNALLPPPVIRVPTEEEQSQLDSYKSEITSLEQQIAERAANSAADQAAWEARRIEERGDKPLPPGDAIVHLPLDGGSKTTATNAGTIGGDLAIKGNSRSLEGKFGQAVRFYEKTHIAVGDVGDFDRGDQFSYGAWVKPNDTQAMAAIARMDDGNGHRGYDLYLSDGRVYVHLIHQWPDNAIRLNTVDQFELKKEWHHLMVTYDGSGKASGVQIFVNGQPCETQITHDSLTDTIHTDTELRVGSRNPGAGFKGDIDDVRVYERVLSAGEVAALVDSHPFDALLGVPAGQRTAEQAAGLTKHYLEQHDEPYRGLQEQVAELRKQEKKLNDSIPATLVTKEMAKPRETFFLIRGAYDKPGDPVEPGVPASLPPLPDDAPPNRLALARWLVEPGHPLTARVTVNRFWQHYFGTGLVPTTEDFGSQGDWPTHPGLLDWLAIEFIESGWDVKHVQRLIVTSATYRQSAEVTPELLRKDPGNLLYTRGPRFRMAAELVRDNALALSGLLVEHVGGPSVKPYQPAGLWEAVGYTTSNTAKFKQDHGKDLYRRSMYTFWKRTSSPPSMSIFDAPSRESCTVRRARTNTPLQALVLMNDPQFVEASRHFAERIVRDGGRTAKSRIDFAFRTATGRRPDADEADLFAQVLHDHLGEFRQNPEGAAALLGVGDSPRDESLDAPEVAAWTMVANLILNLDETITK